MDAEVENGLVGTGKHFQPKIEALALEIGIEKSIIEVTFINFFNESLTVLLFRTVFC